MGRVTVAPSSCQGGNSPLQSEFQSTESFGHSSRHARKEGSTTEQLPAILTPVLLGMFEGKSELHLNPDTVSPVKRNQATAPLPAENCTFKYLKYQSDAFDEFYQMMNLCFPCTQMYSAIMGLFRTHWRAQQVTDVMEFDFHWTIPTQQRHSTNKPMNCPLCLVTGSNISCFFFLFKYSKLFLSPLLSYLLLITTSNSFTIPHFSAFPHFYLLLIPHPSFHFSLEVWHQGSSSVFPLFLGINQGKRDNLDITWSNPCFSCCTSCPFHLC